MKLAVVGAGAMGGALAAEAAIAGHDVHIIDVSTALVETIVRNGLEVRSSDGSSIVGHPAATTDAGSVGAVDVVVVFVKAQHTPGAAETIRLLRGPSTTVVSLQNGWGNADILAAALGGDDLVYGVTYHSCSIVDLGVVAHSGRGETFIGAYAGDDVSATSKVAQLLDSAGWQATVTPAVRTEIWKKLILNAATLPTAALTGLAAGALGRSESMRPVIEELARESSAVARSMGLDIDPDERIDRIFRVLAGAGTGKGSMLQDVEARRKTEVEVINAAIERAGAQHGVPTPLNTLATRLIGGLEESWRQ